MRLEDTRAVVAELVPRLRAALNLEDWLINILYADDDGDRSPPGTTRFVRDAQVHIRGEYMHAAVTIFHENIQDEARLRLALVHEFVHITQWPFWNYSNVIGHLLPKAQREADEVAYEHAVERHVQEVLRWPHVKALCAVPSGTGPGRKGKRKR